MTSNTKNEHVLYIASQKGWLLGLSDAEITKLLEHAEIINYAAGDSIYQVGDTQENLFCIISGLIKVSIVGDEGDKFPLAIWETGSWFGEAALVDESVMPLEAAANSDCQILAIPINRIDTTLDNGALFYKNVLQDMLKRTQLMYKLVKMLLFNTLRARVAARILHLIDLFGEPSEDGLVLPLEFSQADIARMSGGSRQRVNMIFKSWSRQGIVSKKGKLYVVHDLQSLQSELSGQ